MCDEHDMDTMVDYLRNSSELSRRRFAAWSMGAGLLMTLPRAANAMDVVESDVDIKTPDGTADSYFVHPAKGKHPAVLVWTDIMGLRPAFRQMGKRLAEQGYSVLVPNPFYRKQKAPILPPGGKGMEDPATRQTLMAMGGSLNPQTHATDARAFIPWLDAQASVDTKKKIGTTGYCMGGPIVFRTAAEFPNRVGAGATFHGAALATDKPDSPHLLVPKMKGQYLIAIAESDDMMDPAAKTKLREAFDAAKLKSEVEVYAGTKHGWCPPDSAVYDEKSAEKAWSRMLALFKTALA
jgi:carboxymethylenebutenolidase